MVKLLITLGEEGKKITKIKKRGKKGGETRRKTLKLG